MLSNYGVGEDSWESFGLQGDQTSQSWRSTSLVAQSIKNLPADRRPGFDFWVRKIPWRRKRQPTPIFLPEESHGQRSLTVHGVPRVGHDLATKPPPIPKAINPEYSLERLMLRLKLQCFGHMMRRADSLEKTLMLGKTEDRRRRGQQSMRWLNGITRWTWVWASSGRWWRAGKPGVLQSMGSQRVGHDSATEQHRVVETIMQLWEI